MSGCDIPSAIDAREAVSIMDDLRSNTQFASFKNDELYVFCKPKHKSNAVIFYGVRNKKDQDILVNILREIKTRLSTKKITVEFYVKRERDSANDALLRRLTIE